MLDFENYILKNSAEKSDTAILLEIEDVEHDLSADISSILNHSSGGLFLSDRFKYGRHGIDIIYPGLACPVNKGLLWHPDHMRHLLSLYPEGGRLFNIDKIILQPRHIEINDIELMSLYVRREKFLVLYLHRPYLHPVEGGELDDYSFLPLFIPQYISGDALWSGCVDSAGCVKRIPPLWYILSLVSHAPDSRIDKFFLACRDDKSAALSENLESISNFYARHGY